jgi:hypothetical protein
MSLFTGWLCYAVLGAATVVLYLTARQAHQQGRVQESVGTLLQVVLFLSLFFFWFIITTNYTIKGLEEQIGELKAEVQKYEQQKAARAP